MKESKYQPVNPLTIVLGLFSICMCILAISLGPIGHYFENKKINKVRMEALNGNKYAIEMTRHPTLFKYEDKKLIEEALNGNINALKIMGYNIKEDDK